MSCTCTVYIEYQIVCPYVGIGSPWPLPSSPQASVSPLLDPGGGGSTTWIWLLMTYMVILDLNRGQGQILHFFLFQWFYNAKSVFLAVYASLRWHKNVNCLFLSFSLITSGVYCSLIKVDRLASCIALRVVGAVLIFFLWRWRKICIQPMGSWPIRRKETGLSTCR